MKGTEKYKALGKQDEGGNGENLGKLDMFKLI